MKEKRHLTGNQRSGSALKLFGIMTFTVCLVFFGVHLLRGSLPPEATAQARFPQVFKALVLIGWAGIATLSAYLTVRYRYGGFLNRLSQYCRALSLNDRGQEFRFRRDDPSKIFRESFQKLIRLYRSRDEDQVTALKEQRQKLAEQASD